MTRRSTVSCHRSMPRPTPGSKPTLPSTASRCPIVKDEKGYILDGFARAKIAKELGYECPSVTVKGLAEQEKRSQVRALNLARRHLDYAAKRQIIADELKENPRRSNNWIAKSLGVDDKTVASVRREMQSTSEIPKLGFTLGSDGKYRPATRSSLPTNGDGRLAHELPGAGEREYIDLDDEEGILRAAAEIRQRRVAERLKEIQERRQQSRPVRIKKRGGPVLHGDCLDLIPTLEDGSVSLVVTSAALCRAACWALRGRLRGGLPGLHGAVDDRPCAQDDTGWIGVHGDPSPRPGWRSLGLRAADPAGGA